MNKPNLCNFILSHSVYCMCYTVEDCDLITTLKIFQLIRVRWRFFSIVQCRPIYSYCETIGALILSLLCSSHHVSVTKLFETHMLIQRQCRVGFWRNSVNTRQICYVSMWKHLKVLVNKYIWMQFSTFFRD